MQGRRGRGRQGRDERWGEVCGRELMAGRGFPCVSSPTTCRELFSALSHQSSTIEKEDTIQVSKTDTRWSQA